MLWMRASASMPMASRIVTVDGYRLLDGGIVDPVPYSIMDEMGYDRNVYVLTQPKGYRKKKSAALPLMRITLRRTPKIAEALAVRHRVYNCQMEEIDARELRGEILVIRPPESLGIGRTEHDPAELERVYQIGRNEARKALPAIRAFFSNAGRASGTGKPPEALPMRRFTSDDYFRTSRR